MRSGPRLVLPVALGLADGVLNALTLASATLFGNGAHVSANLAWRIAVAALVTAGFSVYVAAYAEARRELRFASRQLLGHEGAQAKTQLGRRAILGAVAQAGAASVSSALGALAPLLLAAVLPGPGWIAAVIAIVCLGLLGIGLAQNVLANRLIWSLALIVGGIGVTAVGIWIKIT
jgi:VIT1/CCC1 family predicted Fe2+/Mn2+ transporter